MTFNINSLVVKDPTTIRDDILRTLKNGLINRGITNPQVGPGSDAYLWATGLANEIAVANANAVIKGDSMMPDSATGSDTAAIADLARIGAVFGIYPAGASTSFGQVVFASSQTGPIVQGAQLLDSSGFRFQVSVGGIYANGATIPISSVDTGSKTNHVAGDTLRWVSAPPYSAPTAIVATGGITGGSDAETTEPFRSRLLARLQNPPGGGNWAQIALFAQGASTVVQQAFVYPAVNGPATVHIAVVGFATAASKARSVDPVILSSVIAPTVAGQVPEFAEIVITTVTNVPTDISIGLTLPSSPAASPAGPGGGWVDGTPWPAISGFGQSYANITAVTNTTQWTINAPTAPTVNVSHIAYVSATNWTLYTAKVLAVSGSAGAYVVTTDTPWPNLVADLALGGVGPMVFPQAINTQNYVNALLNQMALMGPGEKTSNTGVLQRGYRHPLPSQSYPYTLGPLTLKAVSNAGNEVLATAYYLGGGTTPAVPALVSSPPNILTPRNIGLYPI
jgi:hypothetical protein